MAKAGIRESSEDEGAGALGDKLKKDTMKFLLKEMKTRSSSKQPQC